MKRSENLPEQKIMWSIAVLGLFSLTTFIVLFLNIPWEWSMFMDDTLYNGWMPHVESLSSALQKEISQYWSLGRFYPVKYIANLLKWRYLPNDPYVFRYFNFAVYLSTTSLAALACLRILKVRLWKNFSALPIFIFMVGASFLHKPILETISLNPLGETWVCFFFSLGSLFLFCENKFARYFMARLCFVCVALSKEPAALVFFASSLHYALLSILEKKHSREQFVIQALLDFLFFSFFLAIALTALKNGSFTKGAYFSTTPWFQYAKDFAYKLARYALWTSPFIFSFLLFHKKLWERLTAKDKTFASAVVFFCVFAFSYLVFMSTQGIVAYQEVPASIAFFGLFSLLSGALIMESNAARFSRIFATLFLVLYCISFSVSVGRWQRFVRGIVEPRRAVINTLETAGEITLLIPRGEIYGHIQKLIADRNNQSRVFEIDQDLPNKVKDFRGKIVLFEFPYYMGPLNSTVLNQLQEIAGGWSAVSNAYSYNIYVGKKVFPGH